MHTYIHTHVHAYMHTYVHTHTCTRIHAYIRTYTHHYTKMLCVNTTCHLSEVGKWVTVYLLGSNCGNTRERSGALPYHLVKSNEKGALGSPAISVGQI